MARYASDNRLNLKVGVSSFSKDLTSIEVIGRVGINSATAQNELDVAGSVNITDGLSVTGLTTLTGIVTTGSDLYVGGNLLLEGGTGGQLSAENLNVTGVTTTNNLKVSGDTETVGVTTLASAGGITTTGGDFFVGGNLFLEGGTGGQLVAENLNVTGVTTIGSLVVTGVSTFQGNIDLGSVTINDGNFNNSNLTGVTTIQTLRVAGVSTLGLTTTTDTLFADELSVTGPSTFVGLSTFVGDVYIGGNLLLGEETGGQLSAENLNVTGVATVATLGVTGLTTTQFLEVIGIGTATNLHVDNDLLVGSALTANKFYGNGIGLTGITSATNATHIYGGSSGQLVYQDQPGITSSLYNGSTNEVLASRGTGNPPQWVAAAPAGAIEGLLVFDEGAQVGLGTTYSGLDFRGIDISVAGGNKGGIATITVTQQNYVTQAGVATAVIGGGASVTSLSNSGITTLGSLNVNGTTRANNGLIVTGITTLGIVTTDVTFNDNVNIAGVATISTSLDVNGPSSLNTLGVSGLTTTKDFLVTGVGTISELTVTGNTGLLDTVVTGVITATQYVGDGIRLSGIVTTITAGPNIAVNNNTGNVTITGLANTAVIVADSLFVSGLSTFQNQVTADDINSTGVITATNYFGSGDTLSGIVTSLIAGNNISVSGSTGQVTITGLANTANVQANTLVVTGVSTLGIITGAESLGVGTVYGSNFVGGTFSGSDANFSGNVTIGGTLTYEDVTSVDAVGFITARKGLSVGFDTGNNGIGVTILASGNGVFAGIVTVAGDFNVGSASSQFTVQQTTSAVEVGIGTIDPNYNLDVRGTANVEGTLTVNNNTVPSLAMVVALGGI